MRLGEMGYTLELEFLENLEEHFPLERAIPLFKAHRLVKLSRPLSEKGAKYLLLLLHMLILSLGWLRIRSSMIAYMDTTRIDRLRREQMFVIRRRNRLIWKLWTIHRVGCPSNVFLPGLSDLQQSLAVSALVASPRDADATDALTLAVYDFKARAENWVVVRLGTTLARIVQHLPRECIGDRLQLAVCVMQCPDPILMHRLSDKSSPLNKGSIMWYPEYIHHECNGFQIHEELNPFYPINDITNDSRWERSSTIYPGYCRSHWRSNHLIFNVLASQAVKDILLTCGLDYHRISAAKVDTIDPRLYCKTCIKLDASDGFVTVYSWRRAVCIAWRIFQYLNLYVCRSLLGGTCTTCP